MVLIFLALRALEMIVCKDQGAARARGSVGQPGGKPLPGGIGYLHGDWPRSGWDVSPQAGQGWRPASYSITGAGTDGPGLGRNGVLGHRERTLRYSFKYPSWLLLYQNPHQIN